MASKKILLGGFSEETMLPASLMQKWKEIVEGNTTEMGRKGYVSKSIFIKLDENTDDGEVLTEMRIDKGEFVGDYGGIIVDAKWYEDLNRGVQLHLKGRRINALDYDGDKLVVVAWESGNWTRLISQSCQPNLKGVVGIGKDGVPVVQLVTTREVKPGEALTLDYLSQNCHRKLGLVCDCEIHGSDEEGVSDTVETTEGVVTLEEEVIPMNTEDEREPPPFAELKEGDREERLTQDPDLERGEESDSFVLVPKESRNTRRRSKRIKRRVKAQSQTQDKTDNCSTQAAKATKKSEKKKHKSCAKKEAKSRNRHGGEERTGLIVHGQQSQHENSEWVVVVEMEGKTPYRSIKMYDCGVCRKRFNRKNKANVHRATHEGGSYICKLCGSKHRTKWHLEAHQKRWHWEEGGANVIPKCDVCGLVMARADTIKRHMTIHKPRVPKLCGQCGRQYLRGDGLKRHMREKHGVE